MDSIMKVFNQGYLSKLDAIVFDMGSRVQSAFAGGRKSPMKGTSLEFSDFRNYTAGDDVRRIDWNSYGRLNKLFIKVFEEERQACLNIFIDNSPSMDYGEPSKLWFSKVFAASAAYIALSASDRVCIYTVNDTLTLEKGNMAAKAMFPELIRFLDGLDSHGGSDMDSAFEGLRRFRPGAGASIVLSDFFTDGGYFMALKRLQYQRQRVCAVQVLSAMERNPDFSGASRLIDMETGGYEDLEIDDTLLAAYKKELELFIGEVERGCREKGIGYMLADAGTSPLEWLSRAFVF